MNSAGAGGLIGAPGIATEEPSRALRTRVIALCALAIFLDGYDIQTLGLAVPGMARSFGVAPTAFAPALSGSLVGMALGAILLSPLADRYGRRRMMIAMLLLIGVTTLGVATAASVALLTTWRIASGLGIGALLPVAITLAAEYAPASKRSLLVTLTIICSPLGSFAAGFTAPMLEDAFGWHGIFGAGGLLPIVVAAVMWVALPESPSFVAVARRKAPAPSVTRLFDPRFRLRTTLLWAIFALSLFSIYSLISWLPTLLGSAGWERAAAQRATGLLALGSIVGGMLLAWAADRGKAVRALMVAYLGTAVVFGLFLVGPDSRAVWLILIALVGAGAIGSQMALGSLSTSFYPDELRSTGIGWSGGIGRLGSIFGPLAFAGLMALRLPATAIIGLLTVPMLLCAICVAMLPRALAARPDA
ncbi:MAG: transporter [Sphingomonas bacterium]|nr:transporter [Sphingomonas bacterium]